MRPAWSEQFVDGVLAAVPAVPLPDPLTAQWAWDGGDGAGVRVAVIDSGIEAVHPLVGGVTAAVAFELDAGGAVHLDEGDHADLVGHGTACAGIIRSVAPACQLYSVRVLGAGLKGKGVAFLAGLRWAVEQGIDVVNLSLSTSNARYVEELHELVDAAAFRGTTLVSAVNNVRAPSYPSLYAGVLSVAAHDDRDPFGFDWNPEPPVHVGAPGIDVEIAWVGGRTITATGNSFAAAHVSGLVARLLSKHPGLAVHHVKTILQALARNTVSTALK